MKMRASNLMVGSVAFVVIAATFAGVLGLRKIRGLQQQTQLRIVFEGSTSGLRKGGNVNFDGVQVGEIISLKLDTPRKMVALVRLDEAAPIRKDTLVGLEYQGLTGVAAVSLTGGAATAPPVPLDADGVPTLAADLSETGTVRDALHNVDRFLVNNQSTVKDTLLSFETYTAALASKSEAIGGVIRKVDSALENFDGAIAKIDNIVPGLSQGSDGELYRKVKNIRELAESFNKQSAVVMEEGRRTLLDISQAAIKVNRKFEPQAGSSNGTASPKGSGQKRP
jgi:phospholipid/cholesterol/gamma-HCH transport system substrate-binding protein